MEKGGRSGSGSVRDGEDFKTIVVVDAMPLKVGDDDEHDMMTDTLGASAAKALFLGTLVLSLSVLKDSRARSLAIP